MNDFLKTVEGLFGPIGVNAPPVEEDYREAWRRDPPISLNFGKHKGRPLQSVPASYLQWVLKNVDRLRPEMRRAIEQVLEGKTPTPLGYCSEPPPDRVVGYAPLTPPCKRCESTIGTHIKISHERIRFDCWRCGLFRRFSRWYDRRTPLQILRDADREAYRDELTAQFEEEAECEAEYQRTFYMRKTLPIVRKSRPHCPKRDRECQDIFDHCLDGIGETREDL